MEIKNSELFSLRKGKVHDDKSADEPGQVNVEPDQSDEDKEAIPPFVPSAVKKRKASKKTIAKSESEALATEQWVCKNKYRVSLKKYSLRIVLIFFYDFMLYVPFHITLHAILNIKPSLKVLK